MLTREQIATRVARELQDGSTVYLDPAWAGPILSALPAGVKLKQPTEGEVDVAVVATELVAANGGFAGELPRQAKRVIAIVAQHQTDEGVSHIVKAGEPLASRAHVVITNMALFDVQPEGIVMREVAQGISALDVQLKSDTPLLASDELKVMSV